MGSVSFHQANHEADYCEYREDEKQNLGNLDRAGGDTAKAKHGCNQCNHQKDNGIVQHVDLLAGRCPWVAALAIETPAARLKGMLKIVHR
jgi:hypothetical protein